MEVILIGYMGCGKSTIAKKLAEKLKLPALDLDDIITKKEQLSIKEIFNTKGEIYFRKLEHTTLKEFVSTNKNYVLAVGGGTPCYANNIELINKNAISFYLKGSLQTLVNRLQSEKSKRPLIKDIDDQQLFEFVAKHLFERNSYYEQATYTLHIDSKSTEILIDELIANMQ